MEASYDPDRVEAAWYSWWEKNDLFKPISDEKAETYTIPIPPPNVTVREPYLIVLSGLSASGAWSHGCNSRLHDSIQSNERKGCSLCSWN